MSLRVLCPWAALALIACSSSSKSSVQIIDGGSGAAGASGASGAGGAAGASGAAGAGGSSAATGKWPDSATVNCSDGTMSNGCPAKGTDYYGQDGNFEINVPSYLANGAELTDSVTGLAWRAGAGDATQKDAASGCATFGAGWRLPSFFEVASLVDHGNSGNAVPSNIASGTSDLWTASSSELGGAGWVFSAGMGMPSLRAPTSVATTVCVSGPELTGQLGPPTDGIVQDTKTGLYWQTGTVTDRNWKDALLYCLQAEAGGWSTGWRLPTAKELLTIVAPDATSAIDTTLFTSKAVWSSTPFVDNGAQAWVVAFGPLKLSPTDVAITADVRCVHDPS